MILHVGSSFFLSPTYCFFDFGNMKYTRKKKTRPYPERSRMADSAPFVIQRPMVTKITIKKLAHTHLYMPHPPHESVCFLLDCTHGAIKSFTKMENIEIPFTFPHHKIARTPQTSHMDSRQIPRSGPLLLSDGKVDALPYSEYNHRSCNTG